MQLFCAIRRHIKDQDLITTTVSSILKQHIIPNSNIPLRMQLNLLSLVLIWTVLRSCVAFTHSKRYCTGVSTTAKKEREGLCTRRWVHPDDETTDQTSPVENWPMEEDWVLMDQLPKFTVGEGSHTRTFWSQLIASTPKLSHRSKDQLLNRCQQLMEEQLLSSPLRFGPSPPLLTQWDMALPSDHAAVARGRSRASTSAVGQLEDGRTVWLQYHVIGRLPGDPFSDLSSSVVRLLPGGYLEAMGGRIYELGQPREQSAAPATFPPTSTHQGASVTPGLASWVPATTGTVSALLASTVLSACIGYGAGLGIIADTSAPHHHPNPAPLTSMVMYSGGGDSSGSTRFLEEPTLTEQEARAQYRILRDERILQRTSARLELDKMELQHLQEQAH